jgi:hypothetical protein
MKKYVWEKHTLVNYLAKGRVVDIASDWIFEFLDK